VPRPHADPALLLGQLIFVLLAEFLALLAGTFLLATGAVPPWAGITIIVAVSIVAIPFVAVLWRRLARASRERLGTAFEALGLSLEMNPKTPVHGERYTAVEGGFDFPNGAKGVKWSAAGEVDERPTVLLHHVHVVHTGNATVPVPKSVAATPCPEEWPVLSLGPETLATRLAELFGSRDIRVEDEGFNRRWRVKCDDEDFAIAMLTPEVQAFLMNAPATEQWAIGRGWIRVARRETVKPDLVPELARRPGTLAARLPL